MRQAYKTDFVQNERPPHSGAGQRELYRELMDWYTLADELMERGCEYFLTGEVDGILYYMPNDEDWGCVIAVDHKHHLACDTGFYEMDDIEMPDSDYALTFHPGGGVLVCRFECC